MIMFVLVVLRDVRGPVQIDTRLVLSESNYLLSYLLSKVIAFSS
jgi:hypothetical protein